MSCLRKTIMHDDAKIKKQCREALRLMYASLCILEKIQETKESVDNVRRDVIISDYDIDRGDIVEVVEYCYERFNEVIVHTLELTNTFDVHLENILFYFNKKVDAAVLLLRQPS